HRLHQRRVLFLERIFGLFQSVNLCVAQLQILALVDQHLDRAEVLDVAGTQRRAGRAIFPEHLLHVGVALCSAASAAAALRERRGGKDEQRGGQKNSAIHESLLWGRGGLRGREAEGEGFEPPSPFGRQFSRLVQ